MGIIREIDIFKQLVILSFLFAFFIFNPVYAVEKGDENRLDKIAELGSHVMSFDLEKSTHIFSKTDIGGIQQVLAKDKSDTEQINSIRNHLSQISNEFKHGNFSNPEKIHGAIMPRLAELKEAKSGQIHIMRKKFPKGAEIIILLILKT